MSDFEDDDLDDFTPEELREMDIENTLEEMMDDELQARGLRDDPYVAQEADPRLIGDEPPPESN